MSIYERMDDELAAKDDRISILERENAALRKDKEQMRDALQTALGSLCSAAIREGVGKHIEAVLSNTKEAQL